MQDTSQVANYDTIVSGEYNVDIKVNIAGTDYDISKIFKLETSCSLFSSDTPSVGGCVSGEIDLEILVPSSDIPRMAKIKPYIRLTNDTLISGWIQKGEYFIDTRKATQNDDGVDVLTIHGYDAMLKAEALYPADSETYPKSDIYVVNRIAAAIGVPVDARTTALMTAEYPINLPATYTMREILGYIAGFYAGNFIISDTGELYLKGLYSIGIETNYLIDEEGYTLLIGSDRILV